MKQVSAAELKARLGKYLGMVKEGETIYVTSHRRTVARLAPGRADESTGIQPPSVPMDQLKGIQGIRPASGTGGWNELLADRQRR